MAEHSGPEGPDLVEVGIPLGDIGEDSSATGLVDGKPVLVVRSQGELRAVGGTCTHYGGPLGEGLCEGGRVHCPWHHAAFDLASGEAIGAPALNPIPVYDVTEREGRVFVTGLSTATRPHPAPPSSPSSVVIVGSGAAGATAAETLRRLEYRGPILLVGDESPVDRPNLSKDYLAGTAPEEWMPLRSPDFYRDQDIDFIHGRATTLDVTKRKVVLDDGSTLEYGSLLFCPGAEPRRLPIPGADLPHVHYLRTLEDSRAIIGDIEGKSRAVIIGAGFIGLEVAASLRHRDIAVTVVAPAEVPLANVIGEALGRFVLDLHEEHGVEFRLGRSITEISFARVVMDDGSRLDADVVVVGVGVTPRVELAEAAGLEIDGGVLVDDRLRTSDPNVWAAGDVARYPDPRSGPIRVEHWAHAQRQGQAAARNMLGHDSSFVDPPFFWSQHYDVPINVTGHAVDWDEEIVRGDPAKRDVVVGYRRNGKILAMASIYRDLESLRAEHALRNLDQEALESLLAQV